MPLLKLDKDDPQKELEFEVACELKLTPEERLEGWYEWMLEMMDFVEQQSVLHRGQEETPPITKRS